MPAVADLLFVVLLGALSCGTLAPRLLGDAGIGWHLRTGQQILNTHAIPHTDSFSSTMSGQPWYAWEWLYDALIAAIYNPTGLNGVVFFSALLIAATFTLVFRRMLRQGENLIVALGLVLLSVCASTIHFLARPHLLSWLLTVVFFLALDSSETQPNQSRRLFWLPALMLLWVNLHGGFLVGLVLLVIYWAASLVRQFTEPDWLDRLRAGERARSLRLITALSVLATFVNPYGYRLHVHIFQYLTNRFLMDHIDEFLSPNFHGAAQACFAVLLLLTLVAVAAAPSRPRAGPLLVILFCVYAGLYAARNIPVSALLLSLVIAPLFSQEFLAGPALFRRLRGWSARVTAMQFRLRGHLWPALAVLLGLWICWQQGRLSSRQVMDASFDQKRFPVQAAEAMARRGLQEPVFALDYWGGYLIYRLSPEMKVFVDDRHDLYGEAFLKDYLKVIRLEPGWDRVLDERRVNWVLMPVGSALSNVLKEMPQWKVVHEDGVAVLFQRAAEQR